MKKTPGVALAAFLALTGSVYAESEYAPDDLIGKIKSTGEFVIVVGNSPVWTTVDASGSPSGVVPDILRAFLEREKIDAKLKPVVLPFDSIIPALTTGKADVAADTMYVTPARQKQILFSDIMIYNSEGMFVAKGNPLKLETMKDLCGHSAGTYKGTAYVDLLEQGSKACPDGKSIDIKLYGELELVLGDVASGRLDAGLVDQVVGQYALAKNPSLAFELAPGYVTPDRAANGGALPIAPQYKDFAVTFNKTFAELLADGTIEKIFDKYGLTPSDEYLRRE